MGSRLNLTFCWHTVVGDVEPIEDDWLLDLFEYSGGIDAILSIADVGESVSLQFSVVPNK